MLDGNFAVAVALKPMAFQKLVREIADINEYYLSSPDPDAGGTLRERVIRRNRKIRQRFLEIKAAREVDWNLVRINGTKTQSCTSSAGNTKRCKAKLQFASSYSILPETIARAGNGFKEGPTLSNSFTIKFTIGKSGSARNVGTVTATAKNSLVEVSRGVTAEMDELRRQLKSLNLPDDTAVDPP